MSFNKTFFFTISNKRLFSTCEFQIHIKRTKYPDCYYHMDLIHMIKYRECIQIYRNGILKCAFLSCVCMKSFRIPPPRSFHSNRTEMADSTEDNENRKFFANLTWLWLSLHLSRYSKCRVVVLSKSFLFLLQIKYPADDKTEVNKDFKLIDILE